MLNSLPRTGSSDGKKAGTPTSPALSIPSAATRKGSASSLISKSPKNADDSGVVRNVALKVIPKKKVKGNEAAVWGEIDVLKGLDHENIVRTP